MIERKPCEQREDLAAQHRIEFEIGTGSHKPPQASTIRGAGALSLDAADRANPFCQ